MAQATHGFVYHENVANWSGQVQLLVMALFQMWKTPFFWHRGFRRAILVCSIHKSTEAVGWGLSPCRQLYLLNVTQIRTLWELLEFSSQLPKLGLRPGLNEMSKLGGYIRHISSLIYSGGRDRHSQRYPREVHLSSRGACPSIGSKRSPR